MTKPIHDSWLIFRRTAREAGGNVGLAFVAPILLSVFLLVLFRTVYGRIADVPGWPTDDFADWIGAGGVFLSVFVGAGYTAGGLLRDIDTGYLERLRLLPVHPLAVLAGKVGFEAVRGAVIATAAAGAAVALGADTTGGIGGLALLIALATGLAVAWNGIFYLTALTTRTHAAVLGLQPLFMPVIMFSTFWVPTALMPGWYRTVATWNPFDPVLSAGRSAVLDTGHHRDLAVAVAVLAALTAVTYGPAVRRYTRLAETG
ncbi:ABC transporter permease [Virgisporangium ochraceum]|uniref:Transport permease protein n=1 Tax=Virgisporangium ochraceum TaxID=65505 RepID=A0A8J3ZX57_9ACTN|nr:ABC transporter permease [Virgisporangium ochraceum]GIJ70818.1 transport permease protein [Virgisporangium ochraceum]